MSHLIQTVDPDILPAQQPRGFLDIPWGRRKTTMRPRVLSSANFSVLSPRGLLKSQIFKAESVSQAEGLMNNLSQSRRASAPVEHRSFKRVYKLCFTVTRTWGGSPGRLLPARAGISQAGRGLPVAITSSNSFSLEDKCPFTDMVCFTVGGAKDPLFDLKFAFSG